MSQITDITLNDSVPTARTFAATFKDGLECKWSYNNGSSLSERPFAVMKMRQQDNNRNLDRKVSIQVVHPYTETVDSVDKIRYASARIEFILPESAAALTVADVLAFTQDILTETLVSETINDGNFPL